MNSIQFRLSLGLFISLLMAFVILWQQTNNAILTLSEQYVVEHLEHDAESVLNGIQWDASANISLNDQQMEPVYSRPYSGQYYQVKADGKLIRSRSLWDKELEIPELAQGERQKIHLTGPEKQPLVVMVYGYYKQGLAMTIAVAEDISPVRAEQQDFSERYSMTVGILLVILIGFQLIVLRVSFYPFKNIQKQIRRLKQGDIELLDANVPEEIILLVSEINHLLTILNNRLQRSRNALGDLAHALKIPLTVIQQLAQSEKLKQYSEISETLQKQTLAMQNIMGRVLKQARMVGDKVVLVNFNAKQELPELVKLLQSMYRQKNLLIDCRISGNENIAIDREDMMELLGNLLDNACKWAQSQVQITIENTQFLTIIIEDDGPGIPEKDRLTLLKRGSRLDEMMEGHGLGLSIVKFMVEQQGGQLELNRSTQLGGLSVKIVL